jgi:hypothetical protein
VEEMLQYCIPLILLPPPLLLLLPVVLDIGENKSIYVSDAFTHAMVTVDELTAQLSNQLLPDLFGVGI